MGFAFSACKPTFSSVLFLVFLSSEHTHLRTRNILLNFLLCWLSVCAKPHHCALIVHSFQWTKQEKHKKSNGSDGGVPTSQM